MKKFLFILLIASTFTACNDGNTGHDDRDCNIVSKDSLNALQKQALLANGWDSTKCYTIEP